MTWVQFRTGAKAHLAWLLVRPRLVWFGVLPLVLGTLACWIGRTEQPVRITGLALELLGLGTALWGLNKTRKDFGRPSLMTLCRAWWAARPHGEVRAVSVSDVLTPSLSESIRIERWTTVDPAAPLDQQFAAMCKNAETLRHDLSRLTVDHDALSRRTNAALEREAAARSELGHRLRGDLERTMADGLLVSLIGLGWILLGTLLTTLSGEISCFLSP
ncbi:MAG: hypothetical protein ACOY6E_10540 [Pseudomonadota bacterium]